MSKNKKSQAITKERLLKGFAHLQQLSKIDYRKPLVDIAVDAGENPEQRLLRIGRLIGVVLKEPFAEAKELNTPSRYSSAYREWDLVDSAFDKPSVKTTWQYLTLDAIRAVDSTRNYRDVRALALEMHHERGFFTYFSASLKKYICGDPDLRKKIADNLEQAEKAGLRLQKLSPEFIVQSGGLALGTLLVTQIPVLGIVGAPVIAGLVLIIYTIGVDAFCNWTDSVGTKENE